MYYEAQISRVEIDNNGKEKKFNEKYLVDALSIVEALARFETEISVLYPDHETKSIKSAAYAEVLDDESADARYFQATYSAIFFDETTGKEKKSQESVLIQADDFDGAKAKFAEFVKGSLVDVELVMLTETKILDYFPA